MNGIGVIGCQDFLQIEISPVFKLSQCFTRVLLFF
ncbi:MAG: hypothetical protein ACJA13_002405, partial [Paraglaciecola sp.]